MAFWSVVRSLPKREAFAAEQLGLRGYETFLPLSDEARIRAVVRRIFFHSHHRAVARGQPHARRALPGPGWRFSGQVPDNEVDALRSRTDATGVI